MNPIFKNQGLLITNLNSIEDRLEFYIDHHYDNVYFTTENGKFKGFTNYLLDVGKLARCYYKDIPISNYLTSGEIRQFFEDHPNVFRVPVVINEELVGEYYDADITGASLYRKIEYTAECLFPIFGDALLLETKGKNVAYCNVSATSTKAFCESLGWVNLDIDPNLKADLIIDFQHPTHFRKLLYTSHCGLNYQAPSEILIPVLMKMVRDFCNSIGAHFIAMSGIMNSEYKAKFPDKPLKSSIYEALADDDYIRSFCGDDLESLSFLLSNRKNLLTLSKSINNGIHNTLIDIVSPGFNVINGQRLTTDVPEHPSNFIHCFGPCLVEGLCVCDSQTIESKLQRMVNKYLPTDELEIMNHGLAYGKDNLNDLLSMLNVPLGYGDYVIWISGFDDEERNNLTHLGIPMIDCRWIASVLNNWCLDNPSHCNGKANDIYATEIFTHITTSVQHHNKRYARKTLIESKCLALNCDDSGILNSLDLQQYQQYLYQHKISDKAERIGCIVMNANPFTNGHKFLVDVAVSEVDYLYVFVVEESSNSLPYIDREKMISAYCSKYSNICVLSGGNILTSVIGFPEYFNRDQNPATVQPILNHKIFAHAVAPILGINIRFFGTEPEDKVTEALNKTAFSLLPKAGIDVRIIKRIEHKGECISARTVRELMKSKQFNAISELVPPSSLEHIKTICNENNEFNK